MNQTVRRHTVFLNALIAFSQRLVIVAVGCAAPMSVMGQVSVMPATGIAPRFPAADAELSRQVKPPSRQWLRDANDDAERFRRIELWGGAGDLEMQDIAHRFEELQRAIRQQSWTLAIYQWEKIRGRMLVAAIKRPVRTQNLEAIFLDSGVYSDLHDALSKRDPARARDGYRRALEACMACHAAEKIEFINAGSVFERLGR